MRHTFAFLLFLYSITMTISFAQQRQFQPVVIGFYNCENLYDTLNDPNVNDEEFLPNSIRQYDSEKYQHKVNQLAKVIASIGIIASPDGPALLGVAEIENRSVLQDIIRHPLLLPRRYHIIHYDSKDARGVDVALLYQPKYFQPDSSRVLTISLPAAYSSSGKDNIHYTRDILWVSGVLNGERIDVYVNHWPSRLGGERYSYPLRAAAASVCRRHCDSILLARPGAKVFIMGDFNDDPTSRSITNVLGAKGEKSQVSPGQLYNPWYGLYRKGNGTLAYQDNWSLFDQILLSHSLLQPQGGYFFYKAAVFRQPWMQEQDGRYKGYPLRSWDRHYYLGGFSDHFPVYVILLRVADDAPSGAMHRAFRIP